MVHKTVSFFATALVLVAGTESRAQDGMKRLLFAISILVLASQVRGQDWTKVSQPIVNPKTTPYFLNANVGFTLSGEISFPENYFWPYPPSLERTTNGGITWSVLTFLDSARYSFTQLSFVSLTHGYASAVQTHNFNNNIWPLTGGIFETFDQGSHWKKITPEDLPDGVAFSGVYATNHAIFASEFEIDSNARGYAVGPIIYSSDDGATWDSITKVAGLTLNAHPQFQYIYGNRDSLVATIYFTNYSDSLNNDVDTSIKNGDAYLVFSTDLGRTWNSSLLDHSYHWPTISLHIPPHSCNIVREFLDSQDQNGDTYSFIESSPPYVSWDSVLMHTETGAWIAGTSCESYLSDAALVGIPTDRDTSALLFRSTDQGLSWKPIHKERGNNPDFTEMDDADFQNLSVVGYGAVVYADNVTPAPGLWKTTDGGDGTLSAAALAPQFALGHSSFEGSQDTLVLSSCSQSNIEAYNQNIGCSYAKFDSISISGLNPSEFSIVSTHHCACQPMPDTSFIAFNVATTGTRNVTIHYHFTDDEFNQIDTSIQFILNVRPGGNQAPITLSFQSSSMNVSPGDTISVPIYLSGSASLGATRITLPFGVDTNILVPVGFQSVLAGLTVDSSYYSGGMETVQLLSDSNFTLNGSTLIGYLRCVVYLTDTLSTAITLPTATLNSSITPCVALSLTTDSIAINIVGCGTKILQQFMLGGGVAFGIQRIVPNPAQNEITIICGGKDATTHAFTISDPLGRSYSLPTTPNPLLEKEGAITFDISSLPSGVYFVSDGVSGAKFIKE